jgi:hypothetical protein
VDQADLLRHYGIVPQRQAAIKDSVRSVLTPGNVFGQWAAFVLFGIMPLLLALLLLVVVPIPNVRFGLAAFFSIFGLSVGYLIAHDTNRWVEVDGDFLRWKRLFSGQIVQRRVGELQEIRTMIVMVTNLTVRIHESIFGRVRGFEFRFADTKKGVRVWRVDPKMTHVAELVEAAIAKLYELGDVQPEIIELEGTPLVKRLVFIPGKR